MSFVTFGRFAESPLESQEEEADPLLKQKIKSSLVQRAVAAYDSVLKNAKTLLVQLYAIEDGPVPSVEKISCGLTRSQIAVNTLATSAGVGAMTALTVASVITAGATQIATNIASNVMPPAGWMIIFGPKTSYYLGYEHDRSLESCTYDKQAREKDGWVLTYFKSFAPTRRGQSSADGGCYVWRTLTFPCSNALQITVYGGCRIKAIFQGSGAVTTRLVVSDDSTLVLEVFETADEVETMSRVPVEAMDGVQYITCGARPSATKWHVLVKGGAVVEVVEKRSDEPGIIDNPDRGAAIRQARRAGLNPDGTVGRKYRAGLSHARKELSDFERLDFTRNRSLLGQARAEETCQQIPE